MRPARLIAFDSLWHLTGTSVFSHEGSHAGWTTWSFVTHVGRRSRRKRYGWVGAETVKIELTVDAARCWKLNGEERIEVSGCLDVDITFSPSTNRHPIRRLNLGIGQQATVRAAWPRFPEFTLEPLEQLYRRIDNATYRYESAGGGLPSTSRLTPWASSQDIQVSGKPRAPRPRVNSKWRVLTTSTNQGRPSSG